MMTEAKTQEFPKAFAVWFKDLERWDVSSFHEIAWHWEKEVMAPLGSVLRVRKEKVDRSKVEFSELQPITIHFDGSIDPRNVDSNRVYTMDLFYAHAGDIVISKIDLKNGAVGIVPSALKNVVVTNHFIVYKPNLKKVIPSYFQLIIQAKFFKAHLWRNKVGAEGRKEVKIDFFEALEIPLPPISIQQAIVDRWQAAQTEIKAAYDKVEQLKISIDERFFEDLGLKRPTPTEYPKAFSVQWENLFRWNGRSTLMMVQMGGLLDCKYPVVSGYECLLEVKHGCSASPSLKPTSLEVLKISSVTKGEFLPSEKKYAFEKKEFRETFNLKKGDVLMCRTNGTLSYVGMSAIINEDMNGLIFPDKVIRVRVKENLSPEYCWKLLQLQPLREQIEAAARTAVGNYAIGTDDIWNLQIPLPPLEIQQAIMKRVNEGLQAISFERDAAEFKRQEIETEIEALILGSNQIEVAA
jgi:type I restriction enzyme, S subunit